MVRTILAASLVFAAACLPQPQADSECRDDNEDCPSFSKDATKVSCDCTCEVATGLTTSRSFAGPIETCLPPRLNRATASEVERVAIEAMPATTYNRAVYDTCRDSVATFIQTLARTQVTSSAPLCMTRPVTCRCAPREAWKDPQCERTCPDIECTTQSCEPLLREKGTLYVDACVCTRVRTCGATVPGEDQPPLCRVSPPL